MTDSDKAKADAKPSPMATDAELQDALPIKKSGPTTFIAAGVGGVAVILVLVLTMGGENKTEKAKRAGQEAAAANEGLTKEQLKERQEHLRRTQEALAATEAEKGQETAEAPTESPQQEAPKAQAKKSGSKAPQPRPVDKKKNLDSLDSLGSDIASALE